MKKRVLSMLMALALCLTLLPTAALAEENTTEPSTQLTEPTPVPQEPKTPDQGENTETPDQPEEPSQDEPPAADEQPAVQSEAAVQAAEVPAENAVAQVGNVNYANITDAFAAVKQSDGGTLTLLASCETPNTKEKFDISGNYTLDLNGCTLTGRLYLSQTSTSLTVKDSGTGGRIQATAGWSPLWVDGGDVTIESGTLATEKDTVQALVFGQEVACGTLTITGGSFETGYVYIGYDGGKTVISGGAFHDLRVNGDYSKRVTLSGGTFDTVKRRKSGSTIAPTDLLADGYTFVNRDTGVEVSTSQEADLTNVMVVSKETVNALVSLTVDGTKTHYYGTFEEALTAAQQTQGGTLTLLNNVTTTPIDINSGTFTLDLNGHTLTSGYNATLVVIGGSLTIQDSKGSGVISSTSSDSKAVWCGGGNVTILGGSFQSALYWESGTVSLQGGAFCSLDSKAGSWLSAIPERKALERDGQITDASAKTIIAPTGFYVLADHKEHNWQAGKCACGREHTDHTWEDGECTVCHLPCSHGEIGGDGVCQTCGTQFAVKAKGTYYKHLADALAEPFVHDVTLVADDTLSTDVTLNEDIFFYPNGHTVSGKGAIVVPRGKRLELIEKAGNTGAIRVEDGGTLMVDEGFTGTVQTLTVSETAEVELLGGTYGTITGLREKAGTLLYNGNNYALAFKKQDGSFARYDQRISFETPLENVTVAFCRHEQLTEACDGACEYCNGALGARIGSQGYWNLNTEGNGAVDNVKNGETIVLLKNSDPNFGSSLKSDRAYTIDLNGHSTIKGWTVYAGTPKIVDSKGGGNIGQLSIDSSLDLTLADLLPEGWDFRNRDGRWLSTTDLKGKTASNVTVAQLPIQSMNYPTEMSMTYGGAGTLIVNVRCAGAVTFQWYKVEDGNEKAVGSETTKNQFDFSALKLPAGKHIFRFSATCNGYKKMSQDIVVTVQKADIRSGLITPPTAQENLTYTGQEQELITAGSVTSGGTMQYSLTENGTYSQDTPVGTDAGTYTVWYRVIGDENHNNTTPASVAVSIGKKPLTITGVTAVSKPYDGTTNAGIPSVTFDGVTLNRGTDYTVAASFDDASVGNGKNVTATVTLMGQAAKNYALEQSSFPTTGSIIKAAAPDFTKETALAIINGYKKTYTVTLPTLPTLEKPKEYGAPTYELGEIKLNDGYYTGGAKVENGELTLPIQKNDVKTTGSVGTATVVIKSTNYEDITLTVKVNAANKIEPTPDGEITATPITYGDTLSNSKISGKMKDPDTGIEVKGTFAWKDESDFPIQTGDVYFDWTFTPAEGYEEYAAVTDIVKVPVAPKSINGATITLEKYEFAYNAAEQSPKITGVTLDNWDETRITYVIKSGDKATDANDSITLTIEGTGNYTGKATVEWKITPREVTPTIEVASCTYTGDALEPTVTVKDDIGNIIDQKEYEIFYSNNTNAGIATVTIKDVEGGNYVLSEANKTFEITKAAAPAAEAGSLTITNGTQLTYTYDFKQLLPEAPNGDYGTVRYDLGNRQTAINFTAHGYYLDPEIAEFEGSKLTLVGLYAKDGTATGQIGTVKVNVTTTNYENFQLTLVLNAVNQIKPTPDGEITAAEITYGDALSKSTISGKMKDPDTGKSVNGTFAWTDGTINPNAGGYEAEWTFTPAAGYEKYATATGTATVKVKPAKLIVSVKASSMYYTGEEQIASIIASGQSVDSTHVTFTYSDKVDGNYTSGVPTFTDAGTYTAYYKAEAANHEPATGTFTVTIDPLPISLLSVSSISKTYDGSADVTLTADKLTFFSKTAKATNIKLPDTALTFSDAQFTSKQEDGSYLPSPEVGNGKALSFTMTLTSNNYVFEGKSEGTTKVSDVFATDDVNRFTITKAAAPTNIQSGTLTITNGLHKTYSFDLSTLLPKLTAPCDYGTITYDKKVDTNLGVGSFITLVNGKTGELTLEANRSGTDEGQFGAITVTISTSNYQDITLTVNIFAKNKLTPVMDGKITASKITYGQALSDSSITGKMKDPNTGATVNGTFTWTDGTIKPDANDRYEAEWTFTPDSEEYATVTDTATVEVAPKSIEGAVITLESADLEYNAAEQSPKITGVTLEKWTENITYRIVSGNTATNVNDSLTLTIEGTGNYTGKAAVKWKITPREVTPAIEVASCTYTGDALEPTVTLKDGNEVIPTDEYTAAYSNNTNAGVGQVTITNNDGGNYVIQGSTQDFTITKAAAPAAETGSLTITNGLHKTYSLDLSALLPKLTAPCNYGTITYDRKVDTNLGVGSFITLVDGKTGELILDANRSGTDEGQFGTITVTISTSNYQDITLTINVSAKNRITPTGTPTLSKNAITYGDALNTIALSGKLHDNVNNVDVDGTFEWVDGTHIPVVGNGTYAAEWIFEPTDTEKYLTVSGRSNITVEKATQYGKVSMAGYTYGQAPSTPTLTDRTGDANAQVTYRYSTAGSGSVQTWDIQNPPALNAGTYRMYASIGDTDNYYGFEAVYCEFVVAKATPTYTAPTGLTAKYGQTLADVTLPDGWSWMDSSESVGGASTAAKTFQAKFTPKDTENYNTVENIELEVTVNKADGGNLKTVELEQKYTDASDHTYTPDWAGLPAGQDWTFSSEASIVLSKQDFAADGSLLTYAISGGKAGDKITITLKASCDNYKDFTITLNVTLTEKDDQKPLTITGAGSVVYGQTLTLTTTGGSGTGTVTYRIDTDASTGEATIDPETGVLTPVKVGSVSVIATKAGDNDYNDVTSAPFVLMIKPATPTGEPNYTKITTSGKTLKDAALTIEGSTLSPNDGKLEWVDDKGNVLPDSTRVEANTTYKWHFTPTDTNYTTLTGEVELYRKSSSGGGGWYYSYYTIKATAGTGGSISPSGSVSVREGRDQTFTITPDKSYAVSNVKIDGKSIGAVKSYTFENVSRTHTIEVIFMKANGNPQTGVFVDVATGSYYEDAVDWAVENGITQGTDDTHFAPDGICTRAQAVAFLWRAAGSPKLKTRTMPFTDVPAGSYYYDAVLWAVENGIAKGTSDTTFSPNMTCSRAQIVTFLWRSEKSPAAGTANPFADVKSTAYYAGAVLWAVKEDITKGTTNTTFSPDADCTRAQIVTFLWRCKK